MPDLFSHHAGPALELFRIALGLTLLWDFLQFWRFSGMNVGPSAILDLDTFRALPRRSWTLFQYEPVARFAIPWIYLLGSLASICLAIGFFTKIALLVCLLILNSSINRNRQWFNGGHALAAILLFLAAFSPIGASLSADSSSPRLSSMNFGWSWAVLACKCQLTLMYLASVSQKLRHKDWREGLLVYKVTSHGVQRTSVPMPRAFSILFVSRLLTYAVLAAELVLPILLWLDATALLAIVALAAMHLSFSLLLNVGTFPCYVIASLLLFLPPSLW